MSEKGLKECSSEWKIKVELEQGLVDSVKGPHKVEDHGFL